MSDRGDAKKPGGTSDPHRDLAGVLHDVSNALTVLLGWVGEARSPAATSETISSALAIIEQRARIARDIARHAIGSPRMDEQRPARTLVDEVVTALGVEANRAGVTITASGEGSAMLAGALDVSEVLTNLLLNALAYSPRGSVVSVEITIDDARCWITVGDDGPGVPSAVRPHIFEGASVRPGGTGIGLRHSRALARAWGGEIELLPTDTTRFRVSWPRIDIVPRPPVQASRPRELAGKRILLIEDDEAVTQLLETALEGRGAEVTIAGSLVDLAKLTGGYDAALVDLSPIASDVAGAIARLRAQSPGIEVVLITGSADRLPDAIATEDIKLVRKPFELPEILAALTTK